MLKTKLGVSIALLGAASYFLVALTGVASWATLLIVAYVLFAEDNEWLKKTVVKAVSVSILCSLICLAVGWFDDLASIINIIIHWFDKTAKHFVIPANITSFIKEIVVLVKDVFLVLLGIFALKMKTIRIPLVDSLVDKFVSKNN